MALNIRKTIDGIFEENRRLVENLNDETAAEFIRSINNARSIFFSAQARSGFILRAFCMRLMHLGYHVYFFAETITPAIVRFHEIFGITVEQTAEYDSNHQRV
ncbi:hypothetical protein ACFL7E_01390 [Thermodesulfobacteriota bacterium]